GLVVAVQPDRLAGHAGAERGDELAEAGGVDTEALGVRPAQYRGGAEGLARVVDRDGDAVLGAGALGGLADLATAGAEVGDVEDVGGRPEPVGELVGPKTADGQPAVVPRRGPRPGCRHAGLLRAGRRRAPSSVGVVTVPVAVHGLTPDRSGARGLVGSPIGPDARCPSTSPL